MPDDAELYERMRAAEQPPDSEFDVPPWDDPVDLAGVLFDTFEQFPRYLSLDDCVPEALTLYTGFTWVIAHTTYAPRLLLRSPTPGCGKSTTLDILSKLVRRPEIVSEISRSALLHSLDEEQPTMLIDEADHSVRHHRPLFAILNGGWYRPAAFLKQRQGGGTRKFCVYGPIVFGAIGSLLPTLQDRCILLELQRATPEEGRPKFRAERAPELRVIARKLRRWVMDNGELLDCYDPIMPTLKSGRAEDNWRMLIAIADLAGGDWWPRRAREVAVKLDGSPMELSENELLIRDLRAVWPKSEPIVKSIELVAKLQQVEGSPWPSLTTAKLASVLRAFPDGKGGHIRPLQHHRDGKNANVYHHWQFADAFRRYARAAEDAPSEAPPPDLFPTCLEIEGRVAEAREEAGAKRAEKVAAYQERVRAWRAALVAKSDADRAKAAAEHDRRVSELASTPSTPSTAPEPSSTIIPPITDRKKDKHRPKPGGGSVLLPPMPRPPHLSVVPKASGYQRPADTFDGSGAAIDEIRVMGVIAEHLDEHQDTPQLSPDDPTATEWKVAQFDGQFWVGVLDPHLFRTREAAEKRAAELREADGDGNHE